MAWEHHTTATAAAEDNNLYRCVDQDENLPDHLMNTNIINCSGLQAHKLSATHLLASPDENRNPLNDSTVGYSSNPEVISPLFARTRRNFPRYGRSLFSCFFACHRSINQFIVRRKMERGLRLYQQNKQHAAIRLWKSALKSSSKREDSFALLSYLYQGHMDSGKFREALEYGHLQLGISEELDSSNMRAEAYLNLACAHERLGCLERALSYARHSLYNECDTQCRTGGLVHLTVASVYLEMGGFCRALEDMQTAYRIAMQIGDPALELQVYMLLSELFERLQDSEKATRYAAKAYDLSRSLQLGDLNSRYHRAVLIRMASAFRKQGEFGDAHDYCSEASRLALVSGDHGTLTRSIRILGDIFRKKLDIDVSEDEYTRAEERMRLYNLQKALRQYEQAMGAAANMGDRMAQMEAMDGVARCLDILRLQGKICNCRPLEFNTRLLEVASQIGARMLVLKTRQRLASIYEALGDEESCKNQTELANQTELSLGLNCGSCGEQYGLEADSLEALPCAHILHARCAHEILRRRDKSKPRACPACNRLVNSRLNLCEGKVNGKLPPMPHSSSVTPPHPFFQSNLFLQSLSLRASSLTINSEGHVTSSV